MELMDCAGVIEDAFGKAVTKKLLPLQADDELDIYANVGDQFHCKAVTTVNDGIHLLAAWHREFVGQVTS